MKLTPVESSNIAAVGYIEGEAVLLVKYKTNHLYAFAGVRPEAFEHLLSAPSKGKFLAALNLPAGVLISKGSAVHTGRTLADAPLNTFAWEVSAECQADVLKQLTFREVQLALAEGARQLKCRHCGQLLHCQGDGPQRHWRITPQEMKVQKPLDVIDEDASQCCRKYMLNIFAKHEVGVEVQNLECKECGTNFRPRMVGSVRHWAIFPLFAVHRNR